MQHLFDLPVQLVAEILSGWQDFDALLALDRAWRAAYLDVLHSNECCSCA
jgi:hypothetical protein